MVLDLARPSELWCFAAGGCFFRSCFTGISSSNRRHQSCEQPQATESLDNLSTMCCFSSISRRHVREFFGVVLDLARPSEPWCFAAGSCFFRSCFTGISSSSRRHQFCEQPQATESVDKCCFSRFPDDTLGSFFAWFWTLLVLPSHGVLLPGAAFFEAVLPASAAAAAATSSASSRRQRRQQNLSTLLVLQSHGVLLPGAAFFEAVLPASAAAAAGNRISRQMLFF